MKLLLYLLALTAAAQTEKFRNDRVAVFEDQLAPGSARSLTATPTLTVYISDGRIDNTPVIRGETVFEPTSPHTITNSGLTAVKLVRIEFPGAGSSETFG